MLGIDAREAVRGLEWRGGSWGRSVVDDREERCGKEEWKEKGMGMIRRADAMGPLPYIPGFQNRQNNLANRGSNSYGLGTLEMSSQTPPLQQQARAYRTDLWRSSLCRRGGS